MADWYYRKHIEDITGILARTISFYVEKVGIKPDFQNGGKKGRNRKYSEENIIEIIIADMMSNNKTPLHISKGIIQYLQEVKRREQDWYIKTLSRQSSN